MKRILGSLLTISAVSALTFGVTQAFFSDQEISQNNQITTGTIDIDVTTGDQEVFASVEIADMKPSFVRWTRHVVKNTGNNPLRLWKHILHVETDNNGWSEPECTYADPNADWTPETDNDPISCLVHDDNGGAEEPDSRDEIHKYIVYDMYLNGEIVEGGDAENDWLGGHNVNGEPIIIEADGISLHDIESNYVYLTTLEPNGQVVVWQSYHMRSEVGNWAQTDTVEFDIEFYAEQVNGDGRISGGPASDGSVYSLRLENKVGGDMVTGDGIWGMLKWAGDDSTFDYTFEGHKLSANTDYSLIYYADGWPGNNPGKLIGSGSTDVAGELSLSGTPNLGLDLPSSPDTNYPLGAKIWLVTSSDYDGAAFKMTTWNPDDYLFEYNLMTYDDTDV